MHYFWSIGKTLTEYIELLKRYNMEDEGWYSFERLIPVPIISQLHVLHEIVQRTHMWGDNRASTPWFPHEGSNAAISPNRSLE